MSVSTLRQEEFLLMMENLNLAALYTWTDENVDDLVRTLSKIPPNAAGASPYVPV
jgi:hypothetical protein